ncbi:hypothetical protein [Pseudolactococcus laudensis]|uniref:hypothetical protein n=1 Tax=Pseudolactococcus laudensis TaxID=1494461 RepID=UPI0002774E22|nr:hypothetical protein BN193_06950 [Lactococcus raffinolactis 4877]
MKTDSVTMLIEENNQLREKLNAENKVYYDKILLYMRSTSLFKTDLEIENILLDLLRDLMEVPKNGESASEYFGKNPQEMCQELLDNTSQVSFKNILKTLVPIVGGGLLASTFFGVFNPVLTINFFHLILEMIVVSVVVWLSFRYMKKTAFKRQDKFKLRDFVPIFLNYSLVVLVISGIFLLSILFMSDFLVVTIPAPYDMFLIIFLTVMLFVWEVMTKSKWFKILLPVFLIMGILTTLARTALGKGLILYFSESEMRMVVVLIIVYIIVMLAFSVPILLSISGEKKRRKSNVC